MTPLLVDIAIAVVFAVLGFVAGILVGRKHSSQVEAAVAAGKKVGL